MNDFLLLYLYSFEFIFYFVMFYFNSGVMIEDDFKKKTATVVLSKMKLQSLLSLINSDSQNECIT